MAGIPKTDFHMHASYYRATDRGRNGDMTVANVVRRCQELAFDSVGILEHLNDNSAHTLEALEELVGDFRDVSSDIDLYVGAEFDVDDENGTVSGSREIKERLGLDFCLASWHSFRYLTDFASAADFVDRYHRSMMDVVEKCDFVDVIAHPWDAVRWLVDDGVIDSWRFEMLPERYRAELIAAMRENEIAIEVNGRNLQFFDDESYCALLNDMRRGGVKVSVGSDAHKMPRIGESFKLDALLEGMGFTADDIFLPKSGERKGE